MFGWCTVNFAKENTLLLFVHQESVWFNVWCSLLSSLRTPSCEPGLILPWTCSLLLALVLVELQNTCKIKGEQKNARKAQHMLYLWKAEGSRMSNNNVKKNSLLHNFRRNSWKLGSLKLLLHVHFWAPGKNRPIHGIKLGRNYPGGDRTLIDAENT